MERTGPSCPLACFGSSVRLGAPWLHLASSLCCLPASTRTQNAAPWLHL